MRVFGDHLAGIPIRSPKHALAVEGGPHLGEATRGEPGFQYRANGAARGEAATLGVHVHVHQMADHRQLPGQSGARADRSPLPVGDGAKHDPSPVLQQEIATEGAV